MRSRPSEFPTPSNMLYHHIDGVISLQIRCIEGKYRLSRITSGTTVVELAQWLPSYPVVMTTDEPTKVALPRLRDKLHKTEL